MRVLNKLQLLKGLLSLKIDVDHLVFPPFILFFEVIDVLLDLLDFCIFVSDDFDVLFNPAFRVGQF